MNDENKNEREKIAALHQAALKLSEAGENERALELLRYALELDTDFASTRVLLGLTYQSLSQHKEAEEHFFKAVELDPGNSEALQSLGLFLVANERKVEGVEWLQKYIEAGNWGNTEIFKTLIELLDELDLFEEALLLLQRAWLKSRKAEIGRLYAQYLEKYDMQDEAYWIWKIIAWEPKRSIDYFDIATELFSVDKCEEAIKYLKIAEELENTITLAKPGFTYEEYEAAGEMWPYDKEVNYHDLGWIQHFISICYLHLRDGNSALEAINDAMISYGADALDYLRRAEAFKHLEKYEEVLENADKGLELIEKDERSENTGEQLYHIKAFALSCLGRQQEALETLLNGIKRYPLSSDLYNATIPVMYEMNLYVEAIRLYEKAAKKEIGVVAWYLFVLYIEMLNKLKRRTISKSIKEASIKGINESGVYTLITLNFQTLQEYPTIIDDYLNFLQTHYSNNVNFLNLQALLLAKQGNLRKAEKILSGAIRNLQSKIDEQVIQNNLGYIYLLRGIYTRAERCFHAVIDIDATDDIKGYPTVVEVASYRAEEITSDDLPIASRALDPKSAALANLSILALSRGEYDTASKYAIQVLGAQPENSLGFELLGYISLARGDQQSASEAWVQALDKTETKEPHMALHEMWDRLKPKVEENSSNKAANG